jgi:hypothetical protein
MQEHSASMTTHNDRLGFLLTAAAWQDSLLQSYRTLLLSLQTLLLALGTALFVAGLAMNSPVQVYVVSALVLIIAFGGSYTYWRLQSVIQLRSSDVDFWHEEILLCETSSAPAERLFTWFKIYQQGKEQGRAPNDPRRHTLLEDLSIRDLTGAGLGYTRKVIDRQVGRTLLGGWALLVIGTAGYTVAVAIAGIPFR